MLKRGGLGTPGPIFSAASRHLKVKSFQADALALQSLSTNTTLPKVRTGQKNSVGTTPTRRLEGRPR